MKGKIFALDIGRELKICHRTKMRMDIIINENQGITVASPPSIEGFNKQAQSD